MTRSTLLIFLVCLLFWQCQNNKHYSLSKAQMAVILADLHVADGATSLLDPAKKDSITKLYYRQIFEIQGIQEDEFRKNIETLKFDADEMAKVYKMVVDTLEKRKKYTEQF